MPYERNDVCLQHIIQALFFSVEILLISNLSVNRVTPKYTGTQTDIYQTPAFYGACLNTIIDVETYFYKYTQT